MGDDNKTAIAEKVFDFELAKKKTNDRYRAKPSIRARGSVPCVFQETWYYL